MAMSQQAWLFLGLLATVASSSIAVQSRDNWRLRVGGEGLAVLLWFAFALNAFAVVQIDQSGTRHLLSNPALGYIAVLIGLALLGDLLAVIFDLLGDESSTAA